MDGASELVWLSGLYEGNGVLQLIFDETPLRTEPKPHVVAKADGKSFRALRWGKDKKQSMNIPENSLMFREYQWVAPIKDMWYNSEANQFEPIPAQNQIEGPVPKLVHPQWYGFYGVPRSILRQTKSPSMVLLARPESYPFCHNSRDPNLFRVSRLVTRRA
jgi:hypothetical protein